MEKFDFSKISDQKKFDQLPKEFKDQIIGEAYEESLELNKDYYLESEKNKVIKSIGARADVRAKVEIGKVFRGYFNSPENARIFNEIGISKILSHLPELIKYADFGGADGFLAKSVVDFLRMHGKTVEGLVVDINSLSLGRAQEKGLKTLKSNLEDISLEEPLNLITARAVLHYNPKEIQKKILENIKNSLERDGYFVHSMSSADKYNCELRNKIALLPSLERMKGGDGSIHFLTIDEYLEYCEELNFPTELVGYAPPNYWTPEEMFDRFHPEINDMTKEQLNDYEKRNIFLRECMSLVSEYLENTPVEGVELEDKTAKIFYKYPIFNSRNS